MPIIIKLNDDCSINNRNKLHNKLIKKSQNAIKINGQNMN